MSENTSKPAWLEEGRGAVSVHHSRSEKGWVVEARWWADDVGSLSSGPREVIIRLADDASPATAAKGVNTGVVRRVERIITELTEELHATSRGMSNERHFRQQLATRVKELPKRGARSNTENYYRELLDLFEELESSRPTPVNDLAVALGLGSGTVRSQIQRAKQRRREAGL